ncbi:hypothetical protein NEISICOT_03610 [Neisseria sicca ATCC 29256]|uniref:Uncharacterized protein n=1 Tax=Neisseria sicca ATCC 29256 TaxID=547045 RepID=C6MAM8_NEISI|nr:hypothetical protein NEISICOT_03610 [Neisseria sicca ATCC 29256]
MRLDFYPQSRSSENLHSDDLSTVYPICFTVDDVQVTIRTSLSSLNSTP